MRSASLIASSKSRSGPSVHARRDGVALGLGFIAHQTDGGRGRPDERQSGLGGKLGEIRIFRQEAEARMDRLAPRGQRRGDDVLHIQIAFRGARRPDAHRFIRDLRVQCLAVGLGIYRDRNNAQVAASLYDADRDLAAVRDEYLLKHCFPCLSP